MKQNTTYQLPEPKLEFDGNGYCEISEDDFATLFRPLRNHLNPNASFDWGDGYGTLFMRIMADRLLGRYPHLSQYINGTNTLPWSGMLFIQIVPQVVSILDYRERFGHTKLVDLR